MSRVFKVVPRSSVSQLCSRLSLAAERGHTQVVEELLAKQADGVRMLSDIWLNSQEEDSGGFDTTFLHKKL